jgi:hypothetical protein
VVQGIFLQSPQLISQTPEQVNVVTVLAVCVQAANLFPALYLIGLHYRWRPALAAARNEAGVIYALLV